MNIITSDKSHTKFKLFFDKGGYVYFRNERNIYQLEMFKNEPCILEVDEMNLDLTKENKGDLITFYGNKRLTATVVKDLTFKPDDEDEDIDDEDVEIKEEKKIYYEDEEYEIDFTKEKEYDGFFEDEDKINNGGYFVFAGDEIEVVQEDEINATYETYITKNNHVIFMTSLRDDTAHYRIIITENGIVKYRNIGEKELTAKLVFNGELLKIEKI
jgi:hypothetical protein